MSGIGVGCETCGAAAPPGVARCLECGARLSGAAAFEGGPGARAVREILGAAGVEAASARVDETTWRLSRARPGGSPVELTLRISGDGVLTASAPVARLPATGHEPLYRALLTLNDATTGLFRLALREEGTIELCFDEPISPLREREVATLLDDLVRHADHWQRRFAEAFDTHAA